MTKRDEIEFLKHEANQIKSRLIDIERRLEPLSVKEADRLSRIIGRLEAWQNS